MSHKLDLRGRLDGPAPTITLADLLLTKLQVWEINRKDLGDTLCLLADHALYRGRSRRGGNQPPAGARQSSARTGVSATPWSEMRRRWRSCGHASPCPGRPTMSLLRSARSSGRSRTPRSPVRGGSAAVSVSESAGTRHQRRSGTDPGGAALDFHRASHQRGFRDRFTGTAHKRLRADDRRRIRRTAAHQDIHRRHRRNQRAGDAVHADAW